MSEKISQCNVCQEPIVNTSNYSIKIIPGKRVPRKVTKGQVSVALDVDSSASIWGLTKFQKYLARHSVPKNYVEITCGNCKSSITHSMSKKNVILRRQNRQRKIKSIRKTQSTDSSSKKKRKKNKDLNAGLLLPESFRSPSSSSPSVSKEMIKSPLSTPVTHTKPKIQSRPYSQKITQNQNQKKIQSQSMQNLLQKALNKSASSSSNNSLQRFLNN